MPEVLTNAAEFTVSEIAQAVKRTVEDEFGHVRVRGEISGFRASTHLATPISLSRMMPPRSMR